MFRLAMKSAGPNTSASTRGLAVAIASMLVNPIAFSICGSIPILPTSRPLAFSTCVNNKSSACT